MDFINQDILECVAKTFENFKGKISPSDFVECLSIQNKEIFKNKKKITAYLTELQEYEDSLIEEYDVYFVDENYKKDQDGYPPYIVRFNIDGETFNDEVEAIAQILNEMKYADPEGGDEDIRNLLEARPGDCSREIFLKCPVYSKHDIEKMIKKLSQKKKMDLHEWLNGKYWHCGNIYIGKAGEDILKKNGLPSLKKIEVDEFLN